VKEKTDADRIRSHCESIDSLLQEIETELSDLKEKALQRRVRIQIMYEWLSSPETGAGSAEWEWFCNRHPEAFDWFDNDGVPK
jgi:hypothetical protein